MAGVARRLPAFGDVQQVVAMASLDVSGEAAPQPATLLIDPDSAE
jgi:hypothetical protein